MSQGREDVIVEDTTLGMSEEFMEVAIGQDGFDDSVECMVDGQIVWDTGGRHLYLCSQSEWLPYQEASDGVTVPGGSPVVEAKPSDGLGTVLIVALFVILIAQAAWSIRRVSRLDRISKYVLSVLSKDVEEDLASTRREIQLLKDYLTDKFGREA